LRHCLPVCQPEPECGSLRVPDSTVNFSQASGKGRPANITVMRKAFCKALSSTNSSVAFRQPGLRSRLFLLVAAAFHSSAMADEREYCRHTLSNQDVASHGFLYFDAVTCGIPKKGEKVPEGLSSGCYGAPLVPGQKLPIPGDESIVRKASEPWNVCMSAAVVEGRVHSLHRCLPRHMARRLRQFNRLCATAAMSS
jgi:hypothetical protein